MGLQKKQRVRLIEFISVWNYIKIYIYSIIYGIVFLSSILVKWAWRPKTFFSLQKRDRPPPFLVDNSFGQHYYVKLNGVKFHYVEHGERNRPVVLLLHGFPDCWISWRHQIPLLSKHFRVIALDLKGFGDSDKPLKRRCYRVQVLLHELHEFINSLGVSSCIIIGHDLGAFLGWLLIYNYPGLVTKFVAISCPHPNIYWDSLPQNGTFSIRWVHFSQLPYLPEIDSLKEDLSIITQYYHHINGNGSSENISALEAYKYSFSRSEDWTGPINYYRNLPFVRLSQETKGNCLGNEPWKGGQVLLMSGGQDSYTSLESIIRSMEFLPRDAHATVRAIPGAGHFPHQENHDVVNTYLLDFLHVPYGSLDKENVVQSNGGLHKRLVNRVLESSWVRYGNQVLDAAKKGAVGAVITSDENSKGVITHLGSNGLAHSVNTT